MLKTRAEDDEEASADFDKFIGSAFVRFTLGCFAAIDGGSFSVPSYSRARTLFNRGASKILP